MATDIFPQPTGAAGTGHRTNAAQSVTDGPSRPASGPQALQEGVTLGNLLHDAPSGLIQRVREQCTQLLDDRGIRLPEEERADLALAASWEVEVVALAALESLPADTDNLAARALLRRLLELGRIQMGALGDAQETTAALRRRLDH
jgi:hypothetical protein